MLVRGTLHLRPQSQTLVMLDGTVTVQSGYAIDAGEVTIHATTLDPAAVPQPAAQR